MERWRLPEPVSKFCFSQSSLARVDSGIIEGDKIGVFYDPMIAKVISKGETRIQAIDGLQNTLNRIQVLS